MHKVADPEIRAAGVSRDGGILVKVEIAFGC
jgi:hypothetical protein